MIVAASVIDNVARRHFPSQDIASSGVPAMATKPTTLVAGKFVV